MVNCVKSFAKIKKGNRRIIEKIRKIDGTGCSGKINKVKLVRVCRQVCSGGRPACPP